MKLRFLSQIISLLLLVFVIALVGGCSSLYAAEQAVDQIEDKAEQNVEQMEDSVEPPISSSVIQNAATLTEKEALEIALAHAGFTEDQVTGLRVHFDVDDGIPEYEVDFVQNGWEYDYTIHADTGDILEYDKDND